jgi:hypothetical protein
MSVKHPFRQYAESALAELDADTESATHLQPEHRKLAAALRSLAASPGERTRFDDALVAWSHYTAAADMHAILPRGERARLHAETRAVTGARHVVTGEAIADMPRRLAAQAALNAAEAKYVAVTAK